jgi:hypothetical protein
LQVHALSWILPVADFSITAFFGTHAKFIQPRLSYHKEAEYARVSVPVGVLDLMEAFSNLQPEGSIPVVYEKLPSYEILPCLCSL